MNSTSNNSGTEPEDLVLKSGNFAIWSLRISISAGYLIAMTYIMIMMIIEMYVNGVGIGRNESIGKRIGGLIKVTRLTLAIICNLKFLTGSLLRVLVDVYHPEYCHIHFRWTVFSSCLAVFISYLTVWLRHRVIYNIPAIKHLTNYITRIVSILVIFLAAAIQIGIGSTVIPSFRTAVTQYGCLAVGSKMPMQIPWLIFSVSSVVMQLMMLGLFIYPLQRHQRNIGGDGVDDLTPMLKRALYTTVVCCASDTATSILVVIIGNSIASISMETTLFVNLMMILVCFPEWKTTLFPCIIMTSEIN
uniref:uncharacterized protein LOC120330000 n=1 Tax=Styela clava TaxID=7725 RepID=UPI0019398FEB|nr:uncharacterized protein LOC120330000 [Styela clava]